MPAYVHIPAIDLSTTPAQGSKSQKITDAWVFVDNLQNGIYQTPTTFPIVELGDRELIFSAGVRNNGIKSNPVIYPLFNPFKVKLNLKAGKIDTIRPVVTYVSDAKFWFNEDFETTNNFGVPLDNNTSLNFTRVDNGFEGKSGQIILNKTTPIMEKASFTKAQVDPSVSAAYVEINYKTDAPLTVGILGTSNVNTTGTKVYKLTLFPNKEWNKTYISFTEEIKTMRMRDYQIVLRSLMPDSLTTATIQVDNIKLISK